jgi:hypothetical protein
VSRKASTRGGSIPPPVRDALRARLERHVARSWQGRCRGLVVRFRGAFAYIDAHPSEQIDLPSTGVEQDARVDAEPTRLCRLEYLGSTDAWAFAFYKHSNEVYEPSIFPSGSFAGSPEEAFDCAGNVYLQG